MYIGKYKLFALKGLSVHTGWVLECTEAKRKGETGL